MAGINRILLIYIAGFILIYAGCGKNTNKTGNENSDKKTTDFSWKDNIASADIPEFPVKGYLGGKEVQFSYINFEKWRGSKDNVLNFSLVKPGQNCGFIENFEGFTLMNKGNEIKPGLFLKSNFNDDPASYRADFKLSGNSSSAQWNCAMDIGNITDKTIQGRILMYFNDKDKSWIAGKFEAVICNN